MNFLRQVRDFILFVLAAAGAVVFVLYVASIGKAISSQ